MSELNSRQQDLCSSAPAQAKVGGWRRAGVLWRGLGMSGSLSGTKGETRRAYVRGLAAIALIDAVINALNVISAMHNIPGLDLAEPVLWEGSSWFTLTLFAVVPWIALRLAPLSTRPRWRIGLVHLPALALFAVCHIGGFMLIRHVVYAAAGGRYEGSFVADFPYEFQKDVIGYTLCVVAFRLSTRHFAPVASPKDDTGTSDAWFDIRDGARIIRVKLADIVAITSAGNYVEFVLADGRRPLMRGPLSTLEADLASQGFVRTHRSWLVNGAKVTGLAPEGSGDYRVELGKVAAPLSRRYRSALAQLRGG